MHVEVPDELKKTISSHLWIANVEASGKKLILKPPSRNPPNPHGLPSMTKAQLPDQTQLEAACTDKRLTRMLKGVITNTHCLTTFS